MARTSLYFVAFLLLLTLPTCRNIEQGTVRVSTEEGYYHIFVHAYENGEGLPAADIIEFYGDSIESPPDAGYAEVTVEELHNMGFKTAEEALAHSDSPDGEVTEVDGHQRGCLGSTSGLTTRVTSAMTPGARLSLAFPLNQSGSGIICGSGTRRCS